MKRPIELYDDDDQKRHTVHGAYAIGEDKHITLMYNNRCDVETLHELIEHLKSLPTGRKVVPREIVELAPNSNEPLIGVRVEIMKEDGETVDDALMKKLADFHDKYSWRSYLEQQYTFKMHITLGLKKDNPDTSVVKEWDLVTGKKYYKIHASQKYGHFE